jgi:hypothetical protein
MAFLISTAFGVKAGFTAGDIVSKNGEGISPSGRSAL